MSEASENLKGAALALRQAIAHECKDNVYYHATSKLDELCAAIWPRQPVTAAPAAATLSFAEALAALYKQAEGELAGNAYYAAACKLDLITLAGRAHVGAKAPDAPQMTSIAAVTQTAVAEPSVKAAPTFDDIAALSKARIEKSAAGRGIVLGVAAPAAVREEAAVKAAPALSAQTPLFSNPCAADAEGTFTPAGESEDTVAASSHADQAQAPSFEDIAGKSKARMAASAAEQGITLGTLGPSQAEKAAEEAASPFRGGAAGAGPVVEVAASPVHSEGAAVAETGQAALLEAVGSQAARLAVLPGAGETADRAAQTPTVAAKTEASAPADDLKATTGAKEVKAKPGKSLFAMWFDLLWGRKS